MSVIAAGRDFYERAVLLDTCTVTRLGTPAFNPTTGLYTTPATTVGSDLACHMAPFTGVRTLDEEFGGEIVVTRNYLLKLAWDAPLLKREDIVTMVTSADPHMPGRQFRADQVDGETHQMSRRIICEALATSEAEEDSSSDEDSSSSDGESSSD